MNSIDTTSIYNDTGLTHAANIGKANDELGQEEFLELMTAQLRNQDPFSPMENGEFLSQIAQFGTVSGIKDLQGSFSNLSEALNSNRALQASVMVGQTVLFKSTENFLQADKPLTGAVKLPADTPNLSVTIATPTGQVVDQLNLGPQKSGIVEFSWDGHYADGQKKLAVGKYIVTAQGNIGQSSEAFDVLAAANVDSVTVGNGFSDFTLNLSGLGEIGLNDVVQIK